jgi:hypothetical protein
MIGNAAVVQRLRERRRVNDQDTGKETARRTLLHQALRSPGRPLENGVRSDMEARLGADFSDVRVHTDATAHSAAEAVQAHAFTSGSHIVFQRDRYDTASSAGKRMLAHELTHVVQQRSGPVEATGTADGLRVSDPADRFERAAEATAASAMSAPAPLQRNEEDTSEDSPEKTIPPYPVVQRAVGLEFETGWRVQNYQPGKFPRWLKKKEAIGQPFDGFKLEADEAGGGQSEVEFIVHPPVDESAEGYVRLDAVMKAILQLGQRMEQAAEGIATGKAFCLDKASLRTPDEPFLIYPSGKLLAGPQVTSGLDLAKIPEVETRSQPPNQVSTELAATATGLQERARSMTSNVRPPSLALQGLLALLTGYLDAGGTRYKNDSSLEDEDRHAIALNYPKQIGDVLLARTDLPTLFTLLPEDEQTFWKENPEDWIDLVLQNTNSDLKLDRGDSIISRGVKVDESDPAQGVDIPALTIAQWLKGILEGTDHLREMKDAESMGEFGSRTEEVGPAGARTPVGIFEFRGAQSRKIPLERWGDFAREFHRYITQVHGD